MDGSEQVLMASAKALDTVWVVAAAALVMFMQAGFAMLEGGMVRSKNTINVIMKNYMDMCFGGLVFWALGYGLMFGASFQGWIGTDMFVYSGSAEDPEALWNYTLILFQTMFAATAATIVSGACAERVRYAPYLIFSITLTGLIYPIAGHWVWSGGGWLGGMGFVDFAGSTVVHSVGGWCGLAGVIALGPRLGRYGPSGEVREIGGHNLPLVALGVFILWLGWFGFNGGSTVEGNVSIGLIALNTHLAAAAGACAAVVFMQTTRQPVLMTNALNGGLAGLVGITAGCASMSPPFAVLTGAVAGVVVLLWMKLMDRMQWDDPVGAVAVHGACGAWGTLAAGMFHSDGLFQPGRIGVQLLGIVAYFVWCFPLAFLTFWVLNKTLSLRCDSRAERRGLDYAEHYEISYPEFAQEMLHQGKGG